MDAWFPGNVLRSLFLSVLLFPAVGTAEEDRMSRFGPGDLFSQGGVVVDGIAYFAANDECRREGIERAENDPCVVAFDVSSLERIRTYDFAYTYDSSPLVTRKKDNTWIVIAHEHKKSRTVARNRDTGAIEWIGAENQPGHYFFGYSFYRRDDGSKLILAASKNGLHALSSETGEDVWWVEKTSTGGVTPCVHQPDGLIYYQCDGRVLKIDGPTGEVLREVEVPEPRTCISWNTVLIDDDRGAFVATRWYGKPEWDSAIRVYDHDLNLVWERTGLPNGKKDTLTYVDGKLVCGSGNGWSKKYDGDEWKRIEAYYIADGSIAWRCDLSDYDYGSIMNLPCHNGYLYAESAESPPRTSKIFRIEAATGNLVEVYDFGRPVTSCATHVLACGKILSGDLWRDQVVATVFAANSVADWPGPFGDPQTHQMAGPREEGAQIVPLAEISPEVSQIAN